MRKLVLTIVAAGLYSISGNAQALFTYGSNSVSKDDFLRVYKKNSINKKPDMSDTALKSYLDLYALFRMKVAEADKQQLDTVPNISKELDNYRKQLAKNYLTDEEITNKLVREAYDRMKENVRVAHLLVSCPPGTDTMAAYRKIDSLYHVIETKKADFETITKQFSDDRGTKENGGDVGYFTALQTIYAFENKAYTTPVGKISAPFRTQFGYHIMKVLDKRADKGELKVAQILIQVAKSKGEAGDQAARKRADSVVAMLKAGTPFAELVSKYSDDQFSKNDTGVLKQFGAGKMVLAFENAAYALKKPGDISEPVKTEFGYHVIKLIAKYPLAPYDTLFPKLKRKVENDARAQTARDHFMNKIKEKNGFKEFPENAKEVSTRLVNTPDTGEHARDIIIEDYKYMTKPVFTLAGKNYLQNDFVKFLHMLTRGKLNGPKATVISDAYNMYITTVVNDFQEHKLVEENPEFKHLMEEYRDGIMLFELMDRNVWSKASKDSAGLKKFFEERKSKYMWEPGFEGAVYKFKNKAALDSGIAMIKSGTMNEDQIAKEMNTTANPDRVTIQKGHYEFSKFKDATPAELNRDNMKISIMPDGKFNLVHARKIYSEPTQKTLEDARGYVVAEYQDYLEKQWNAKMRSDYPMKVNDKVFKSMIKK